MISVPTESKVEPPSTDGKLRPHDAVYRTSKSPIPQDKNSQPPVSRFIPASMSIDAGVADRVNIRSRIIPCEKLTLYREANPQLIRN